MAPFSRSMEGASLSEAGLAGIIRCPWAGEGLMMRYHDEEWGVPLHDDRALQHRFERLEDIPAVTEQSQAFSNDLRRRGFQFVGPTICYAFMQSAGLVNDHLVHCFCYQALANGQQLTT